MDDLKKHQADCQKQIDDLTISWKRALADYQNLEKRIAVQSQQLGEYKVKTILKKFLEILDLLIAAQKHLQDEGLDLIVKKLLVLLEQEGVKKTEIEDKTFDPKLMECVEVVEGEEEGKVAEEVSTGYTFNEELLRPTQVKVYKKKIGENTEMVLKEEPNVTKN